MLNWFLIYTKPRSEDRVAGKLIENGFEVLNPKLKERRLIRRKLQETVSPLFPCYLFVRFDTPNDYRLIKYTRGVKSIIGSEFAPTAVPHEIISNITKRMEDGVVVITPKAFNPGDEVLIMSGPLEGLDAVFEKELNGAQRVSILLKTISARVIVDSVFIAKT